MINVLIPMAGRGSRFNQFNKPKPLIEIEGKPMIWYAISSLNFGDNFIYVTRKYDDNTLNTELNQILNDITPNCKIIEIDYVTEGPASSALLAKEFINNNTPLFITNCDRITHWNPDNFLKFVSETDADGVVTTWNHIASTESFIELDENGNGIRLVEKEIISDHPLNGMHYWKKGRFFVESAEEMIEKNIRFNNEFYISATYNQMIGSGLKVKAFRLGDNEHFSLGSPEDVKKYLEWKYSK